MRNRSQLPAMARYVCVQDLVQAIFSGSSHALWFFSYFLLHG